MSEIGFSLFPLLSNFLFGIIVGPLTQEELIDSHSSYKKIMPKYIKNDLKNIVKKFNPKLFQE